MAINNKFYFFSLGVAGTGISGGDRIFIEFARRWNRKYKINISTSSEGETLLENQKLYGKNLIVENINNLSLKNKFVLNYLFKILKGIKIGLTYRLTRVDEECVYLYSCSEFWMDLFPAFILKLRYPWAKWVAAWYQTAPNPIKGYAEGNRENTYNFKALLYWLVQLPIKPIISNFADFVLINNESERKQFPKLNAKKKLIVVIGAIDLEKINKWRRSHPKYKKVYDAVFQGRFHPQKGVVELIEIWKKVVSKIPNAKLVMIGDGPLMNDVRKKIKEYKLDKNIDLLGYVFDGDLKYKTFSQSKIVVHPALYDSGGMASAEAMAFNLPVLGFDLDAYRSYYSKGMYKVNIGNINDFANAVARFLKNNKLRIKYAHEGTQMLRANWSWDVRANEVLDKIFV